MFVPPIAAFFSGNFMKDSFSGTESVSILVAITVYGGTVLKAIVQSV
jgi:hypothetical protein